MPDAPSPTPLPVFVLTAAALICTPGPGTMLTVRAALDHGARAGTRIAAGVVLGQAVWALLATGGVAALLQRSDVIATALGAGGAGCLIALGLRGLWSAARGPAPAAAPAREGLLWLGLASNLLNPKMLVVAASLLPGAALGRSPAAAWTLLLGLLFCLITAVWLGACTALATRAGDRLPVRLVGAVSGAALTALGIRLLLDLG